MTVMAIKPEANKQIIATNQRSANEFSFYQRLANKYMYSY